MRPFLASSSGRPSQPAALHDLELRQQELVVLLVPAPADLAARDFLHWVNVAAASTEDVAKNFVDPVERYEADPPEGACHLAM